MAYKVGLDFEACVCFDLISSSLVLCDGRRCRSIRRVFTRIHRRKPSVRRSCDHRAQQVTRQCRVADRVADRSLRNETRAKDIIRAYVYNLWQAEAKAAALAYLSLCPDEDYSFLQDTFSRLLCSRGNSQEQIQPLVGGIDSYGRRTPALLDELLGDRAASTLQVW